MAIHYPNRNRDLSEIHKQALCTENQSARDEHTLVLRQAGIKQVMEYLLNVCGQCPIRAQCFARVVLETGPVGEKYAIAGGLVGNLNQNRTDRFKIPYGELSALRKHRDLTNGIIVVRSSFYSDSEIDGHSTQGVPSTPGSVLIDKKTAHRARVITDEVHDGVVAICKDYLYEVDNRTGTN